MRGWTLAIAAPVLALALHALAAGAAQAPAVAPAPAPAPWVRFDVPDNLMRAAVFDGAAEYETAFNLLLVAELRAISGSKNALVTEEAARMLTLARKLAKAETDTLGTHIGDEALVNFFRWVPSERDLRVDAAVAESAAVFAQSQRQLDRAESQFRAALALYRRLGEHRREAWVVGSLGVVSYTRGQLGRADSIYREALLLRRRLGDPKLIGNTLNALGITSQQLRRYPAAYDYFQEARAVREGLGDRVALSNTLNLLGLTAVQLGEPDSARIWYDQALAAAVAGGDSARVAEVLLNHGLLRGALGEHAAAQTMIARARAIAWANADARLEAQVERSAADVLRREGRFNEAERGLARAIELAGPLNDPVQLAQDLLMLGHVALIVRDAAHARAPLERSLALADSLRVAPLRSEALTALALLAGIEGDARSVERLGRRALALAAAVGDSELVHDAAATVGGQLAERGEYRAAEPWAGRALAAGGGLSEAERSRDLELAARVAARTGRLDDAERGFRAALDLAERAGQPDLAWRPTLGLGDLAGRRGDPLKALEFDRRAGSMVEALRADPGAEAWPAGELTRRLAPFEEIVHLLGKLEPRYPDSGFVAESFQWAERARARARLDLFEGAAIRAGAGAATRIPPPAPVPSLKEARALLESDREALLEYSVGDSSTSLWVITRRGARHQLLPPRETIRARAEVFRRGLADASGAERRSTITASRALYRALIEPAAADLAGVSRLIVSADDALALIPFEALLASDVAADNAVPAPGSYVIERFTVSYVPSAAELAAVRPASKANLVLALGDVRFGADAPGAEGLAPAALPGTAAEVASLQALAAPRRCVAITGEEATRAKLLARPELAEAGIIHLAAPALADDGEPGRSGLWLSPDAAPGGPPAAAGFLSLDDILKLSLRADLVTLSASETGLSKLEGGEGVRDLTRAFLAAGARSVVLSLWRPEARSRASLVEGFYRGLLQRGLAREEALAEAKRALLSAAETRSPYYWAPLVIVGEGGKLR